MPCIPPVYFVAFCLLNEYILLIKKKIYIYIKIRWMCQNERLLTKYSSDQFIYIKSSPLIH